MTTTMTAEGWHQLFIEVFETETDLAQSDIGVEFMSFAVQLTLTAPHKLFISEAQWDKHGLRATATTNAWTGAYIYFGAPWKQHTTFREYYENTFITSKAMGNVNKEIKIDEQEDDDVSEEIEDSSDKEHNYQVEAQQKDQVRL